MKRVRHWGWPMIVLGVFSWLLLAGPVWAANTGHGEQAAHTGSAEAGHGEAESGEGAHGGVSDAKLFDFLLRIENFIPLALVLFLLLRKPIAKFFGGRRENIAQTLADFEAKKARAEARYKELEGKLDNLEAEREQIMAKYLQEGEEEKAKIIANAHMLAERIKVQADLAIDQEVKAAKAELIEEIGGLAAGMAEDVIKKNINDQDQTRLVEEYLDKVVQN